MGYDEAPIALVRRFAGEMDMHIDKPRHDNPVAEIDDARTFGQGCGARGNRSNRAVGDRDHRTGNQNAFFNINHRGGLDHYRFGKRRG